MLALNPAKLTAERVSVLLRMTPEPADVEALESYEGDKYVPLLAGPALPSPVASCL